MEDPFELMLWCRWVLEGPFELMLLCRWVVEEPFELMLLLMRVAARWRRLKGGRTV